jgi:hypothetical protein
VCNHNSPVAQDMASQLRLAWTVTGRIQASLVQIS